MSGLRIAHGFSAFLACIRTCIEPHPESSVYDLQDRLDAPATSGVVAIQAINVTFFAKHAHTLFQADADIICLQQLAASQPVFPEWWQKLKDSGWTLQWIPLGGKAEGTGVAIGTVSNIQLAPPKQTSGKHKLVQDE